MRKILAALIVLALMAACTKPANPDEAEGLVPQFHMALNGETLDDVYESAAAEMKARRTRAEFVAYLQSVRRKLGNIQSTDRTDTQVDGNKVTLTYRSVYERGPATEQFVIRMIRDKPALIDYRLLSPSLP